MSLKEARAWLRLTGAFVITPSMTQRPAPGLARPRRPATAAAAPAREMPSLIHVTCAHRYLAVPGQVVPRRAAHRGGRGAGGAGRGPAVDDRGRRRSPG